MWWTQVRQSQGLISRLVTMSEKDCFMKALLATEPPWGSILATVSKEDMKSEASPWAIFAAARKSHYKSRVQLMPVKIVTPQKAPGQSSTTASTPSNCSKTEAAGSWIRGCARA
jgi:hypothetical protein